MTKVQRDPTMLRERSRDLKPRRLAGAWIPLIDGPPGAAVEISAIRGEITPTLRVTGHGLVEAAIKVVVELHQGAQTVVQMFHPVQTIAQMFHLVQTAMQTVVRILQGAQAVVLMFHPVQTIVQMFHLVLLTCTRQ